MVEVWIANRFQKGMKLSKDHEQNSLKAKLWSEFGLPRKVSERYETI